MIELGGERLRFSVIRDISVRQQQEAQIARLRALAHNADLDPEFSEKFLRFIIDEVIRHHERLQGGK